MSCQELEKNFEEEVDYKVDLKYSNMVNVTNINKDTEYEYLNHAWEQGMASCNLSKGRCWEVIRTKTCKLAGVR